MLGLAGSLLMAVLTSVACQAEHTPTTDPMPTMTPSLRQDLERLARQRVLFAHHSVGSNMIDGLRALLSETGSAWPVVPLEKLGGAPRGALVETSPGHNGDPISKIDGFAEALAGMRDSLPDLAVVKLCYADFSGETDYRNVFDHYQRLIGELKERYPSVVFGHATVPLRIRERGVKTRIARTLGLEPGSDSANRVRAQYSELLREAFADDPILDIAKAESTTIGGERITYDTEGEPAPALLDAYSSDGGHLNDLGKRQLAAEFARFAATAAQH